MDYKTFNFTLDMGQPPAEFHDTVKAMWWDRKGEWNKAHEIIQKAGGNDAAWVHAYLHRKEGNSKNASYWYEKSGRKIPAGDLNDESRIIISELLAKYNA